MKKWWILLSVILVAVLVSCGEEEAQLDEDLAVLPASEVTLTDVLDNPGAFIGEQITVSGGIAEVAGARAFIFTSMLFEGDARVLVIVESPDVIDVPIAENDLVQVAGTVAELVTADVQEELDVDLDESLFDDAEGQVVIRATSVYVVAGEEVERIHRERLLRPASIDDELTLIGILDVPENYYGQWSVVAGSIAERVNDKSFVLTGASFPELPGLLVVNLFEEGPGIDLEEGMPVLVAGEVLPFARAEIAERLDVELSEEAYGVYEGRPAMLAESLRVIPASQLFLVRNGALAMIGDAPERYAGWQVLVAGDVDEIVDGGAFTLSTPDLLVGNDQVLVLPATALDQAVSEDSMVRVLGQVRVFARAEVEDEFNLGVTDERFADYEGWAVIIADSVEVLTEEEIDQLRVIE